MPVILLALGAFMAFVITKLPRPVKGYRNGEPYIFMALPIGDGFFLEATAARAFNALNDVMTQHGLPLAVNSAFRDYEAQERLYQRYVAGIGNLAARPGYSNHQQGLSVDIAQIGTDRNSARYRFLQEVGEAFGFYNDVASEPWHWTYKGGNA